MDHEIIFRNFIVISVFLLVVILLFWTYQNIQLQEQSSLSMRGQPAKHIHNHNCSHDHDHANDDNIIISPEFRQFIIGRAANVKYAETINANSENNVIQDYPNNFRNPENLSIDIYTVRGTGL